MMRVRKRKYYDLKYVEPFPPRVTSGADAFRSAEPLLFAIAKDEKCPRKRVMKARSQATSSKLEIMTTAQLKGTTTN